MIAVAITMLGTVLPSAATMPIASTNSGNAMMVSAMRPMIRSVQPPKKPAATPERPPSANTRAAEDIAAVFVGAEPVVPGWRLQLDGDLARGRIIGLDQRAEDRAQHDQREQ